MCHIKSCPAVLVSNARFNLICSSCQRANTFTWLRCENHLLHHFGCVNVCHIQAIKKSFRQLYEVSITAAVTDHTGQSFSPKQICVYDYSTGFIMILLLLRHCILWWWQTCLRWHHLSAECILYPGEWRESRILPVRAEPLSSYYMLKCVKYNTVWKHNVSNTSACFMK